VAQLGSNQSPLGRPALTAAEDELSLGLAILDQAIGDATGQL
jgi:hypothetical protein